MKLTLSETQEGNVVSTKVDPFNLTQEQFKQWAIDKYNEVESCIRVSDENGNVDPNKVNAVLVSFSGNFAWQCTECEIAIDNLNSEQHGYDAWYKTQYNSILKELTASSTGSRAPAAATVESEMFTKIGEEIKARKIRLDRIRSIVNLHKSFIEVYKKASSMLQTLSSNLRSEFYFSDEVTMKGANSGASNLEQDKKDLKKVMGSQT